MTQALIPQSLTLTPPATRIAAPDDFKLLVRTLGNPLTFDIQVSNVSRSGMLLEWHKQKFRPPFRENTLLELELNTKVHGETRKVSCMAKVVRRNLNGTSTQYGIRMIHNDDQEQLNWLNMVTSLEKNTQTF